MNAKPVKLERRAAVKRLLADRENVLTISSLGGPAYDVAAATGETPQDFCLGGAMGGAAMMGLGLAIAQPGKRVAVFAGDGETLMALGALATIGAHKPANLIIVVIDNEYYAETGMQQTHTGRGVDVAGVALACGFAEARTVRTEAELEAAVPLIKGGKGPLLVSLKVDNNSPPLFARERDGVYLKTRFRQALLGRI